MSGLVFSALFVVAMVLIQRAPGLGVPDDVYAAFYATAGQNVLVAVGLYIVPFAGIAFLWHLVAAHAFLRAPVAEPPDAAEPTRWLHLVSGVVFVCMTFAGSAAVGGVALLTAFSVDPLPSAEVARALNGVGYGLVFVFGVRVAGMYMITFTTLGRRAGIVPGWLALVGYLAAAFLLVSTTFHPAVLLVFPAWVALVSVVALLRGGRPRSGSRQE